MSGIVVEMLRYAQGSDRAELLELKSSLDRMQPKFRGVPRNAGKRDERKHSIGQKVGTALARLVVVLQKILNWAFYGTIAALLVWVLIETTIDRPSDRASSQPSAPRISAPAPATATIIDPVETIPPVGQGLTLSQPQIRYCVFQGQRLDAIKILAITNNQIDRFNWLVDDFNARCSSYRYRSGDLSSVQREASDKAADLRADARRIVSSW